MKPGNRYVYGPSHGGPINGPRLIVAHSLECDAREHLAYDLATGYIQNEGVSPHTLSDPGETVCVCDTTIIGYHVGPRANPFTNGGEVTGRAAWPRDKWLSDNPNKALQRQAKALAEMGVAAGFQPGEFRWLKLAEVADGVTRGYCYHNDISEAIGGTDHWDPGPGYPADIQMSRIRWYAGTANHWGENPGNKPGDAPEGGGPGGAEPTDWFTAATRDEVRAVIVAGLK